MEVTMKDKDKQGKIGAGLVVGLLLLACVVLWQVYRGATVQKVGIPGIFEVEFGKKPTRFCMTEDTGYDRYGSDYADPQASDLQQCEQACLSDDQCKAVSFNLTSKQCWLKNAVPQRYPNAEFVAAVKSACPR
jgi:hypothetical protein